MKTEKEKAGEGLLYDANYDAELLAERVVCKEMCFEHKCWKKTIAEIY